MATRFLAAGGVALVIGGFCLFAGVAGIAAADEVGYHHTSSYPAAPTWPAPPSWGSFPATASWPAPPSWGSLPVASTWSGGLIAPVLLALNLELHHNRFDRSGVAVGALALLRRRQLRPDSICPMADQRGELVCRAADGSSRSAARPRSVLPPESPTRSTSDREPPSASSLAQPAAGLTRSSAGVGSNTRAAAALRGMAMPAWTGVDRVSRPGITSSAEHPCSVGMTRETVAPVCARSACITPTA